jgi:hypothetical protein
MRSATLVVAVLAVLGCVPRTPLEPAERLPDWTFAQAMSQRRSYAAAAEVRGQIYLAGGMVGNSGRPLSLFQRFDPRRNAWTTLEPLTEPVRAASAAATGERIYVTGGQRRGGVSRRVDVYDVARHAWSEAPPLPAPRFNHSTVALDGSLYVLGGADAEHERRDVFIYGAMGDHWRRAAPLPDAMHAFGAVAFEDEIWTIGGRRGERTLRDVWIYNPRRNGWRPGPALPKPMELLGAAVVGPEVHAVWERTYQIYDARSGRWRQGPSPRVARHALAAFNVAGRLYTIGGCKTPQLEDSQVVETLRVGDPHS